jgi:hypothetical protein
MRNLSKIAALALAFCSALPALGHAQVGVAGSNTYTDSGLRVSRDPPFAFGRRYRTEAYARRQGRAYKDPYANARNARPPRLVYRPSPHGRRRFQPKNRWGPVKNARPRGITIRRPRFPGLTTRTSPRFPRGIRR